MSYAEKFSLLFLLVLTATVCVEAFSSEYDEVLYYSWVVRVWMCIIGWLAFFSFV